MKTAQEEVLAKRAQDLAYWQRQAALSDSGMLAERDKEYCRTLRQTAESNIKAINEANASDAEIAAYIKEHGTDEG